MAPKGIDLTDGDKGVFKHIIRKGTRKLPADGDEVEIQYVGRLAGDDTEFDRSKATQPFRFQLGTGDVIQGLDIGVASMRKGEKAVLTIASSYGYGEDGDGPISGGATLKYGVEVLGFGPKKKVAKERPQTAIMGSAGDGHLAKKMMGSSKLNAVVLKGFADKDLVRWAGKLCRSGGEHVGAKFHCYEGISAEPGESFSQQLQRQLQDFFCECKEYLLEQGQAKQTAELASSPAALRGLKSLLLQLTKLYDSCTTSRCGDMRWKIKIDINQDGACTKYHDDGVNVRFAMSLIGEGTVLADNGVVDWEFYDSCDGYLPESLADEEIPDMIRNFNERVSKKEFKTQAGDLVMMKGGLQTTRPCLHRAPYMAGEGMNVARFLVTVDRMCEDELERAMELDMDTGSSDEEGSGDGGDLQDEAERLAADQTSSSSDSEEEASQSSKKRGWDRGDSGKKSKKVKN